MSYADARSLRPEFEALIEPLPGSGYGVADTLLSAGLCGDLRQQLLRYYEANQMAPAGTGKDHLFDLNTRIRGDCIRWIDNTSTVPVERAFLERVDEFVAYLNRTCFTAINDYEFHYALYEPGQVYVRHVDQFKQDSGRQFSLITYLNPGWADENGGQLLLYMPSDAGERAISIAPHMGTSVFFRSHEIEHEVRPAHLPRLSITGWLKIR